jgi:VWFA-related protein
MRLYPAFRFLILVCLVTFWCGTQPARAQQQSDDVVRVNTELVQTAITVIDKQGRFVPGLNRDQFELIVDGKPRSISFLEQIAAGSGREAQLATGQPAPGTTATPSTVSNVQGRTIIFFIDDMHMSADSLSRTKEMLRHAVRNDLGPRDSMAITTATGQLGLLEQFTRNRQVLNIAIDRLIPKQFEIKSWGTGSTTMREFDALQIDSTDSKKVNSEIFNFYLRECLVQGAPTKRNPSAAAILAASCETQVRNSARGVLMQAGTLTQNMYASLESMIRSYAKTSGRKLAFFISDGFLLDAGPHAPNLRERLEHIIDGAQRSGVVVYTIDSRGLLNTTVDLRQGSIRQDFGRPLGEVEAQQDALHALASDTGGRALRGTNFFERWVGNVLEETANYYLLAWRPDSEVERGPKFRGVSIRILNHPELTVRAPRGYLDSQAAPTVASTATKERAPANHQVGTPDGALMSALTENHSSNLLPLRLSLAYLDTPNYGTVLTSSLQVGTVGLGYGADGRQPATIKLAGVVLTDTRKIAGNFKNELKVQPFAGDSSSSGVIYNQHTPLQPGIYQVRVAARDELTGRVGSAMEFVVIPDLANRKLALSSLLLGGQVLENKTVKDAGPQVQFSVDHRFKQSARLSYWVFTYNAKRDDQNAANLSVQSQIRRNGVVVMSGPPHKVGDSTDPDRIPYGEELQLKSLPPGSYDLVVTVNDLLGGSSETQTIDFEIEPGN